MNYGLKIKFKAVLMLCFPKPSAWAARTFFLRTLVSEQKAKTHGEEERICKPVFGV